MSHPPPLEWAAHAGDESGDVLCQLAGEHKYIVRSLSCTVLDALCEVAHDQDEASDAYCIRRHPHEEVVEFSMSPSALRAAMQELHSRMQTFKVLSGAAEDACEVACPSFWAANVLRRALWNSIHVVACTSVQVVTNTSCFEDAQIAHRCGQIAIKGEAIEAQATVNVRGRAVLARDLVFSSDACVASADLSAPIVLLSQGQVFEAELFFTRGTPLEHAKFHSVVSPSFRPSVCLSRPPRPEEIAALSEIYQVDGELRCTRRDRRPCRIEALREQVPGLDVTLGPEVRVGVESLGQLTAEECVRRARAAFEGEAAVLTEAIIECDRRAASAASSAPARADRRRAGSAPEP